MKRLFTSESVTCGHPDKICDQISDSVLDAVLAQDKTARVACETCCTTGMVLIMGEISTTASVDIPAIARSVINDIGYDGSFPGFSGSSCAVLTNIDKQSPDIALGVDSSFENKDGETDELNQNGAGDQGLMFGYACGETDDLMPMPIHYAHRLARRLEAVRRDGTIPYLRPDGKTQITVEYDDDRPVRIDTVVVSTQHSESAQLDTVRSDIMEHVIKPVLPPELLDSGTKYFINPTGRFVTGGPEGDSGLTGRKIIVDTYGGVCGHGGGCFSGKDPTKVDRSASYAARRAAKNIVAAGLASKCEIQVAYAIGVAHPVSVSVNTYGTGKFSDEELSRAVTSVFDFRPSAIIRDLDLRRPIYRQVASYGHMGRGDLDLPWERIDRVDELLSALK